MGIRTDLPVDADLARWRDLALNGYPDTGDDADEASDPADYFAFAPRGDYRRYLERGE